MSEITIDQAAEPELFQSPTITKVAQAMLEASNEFDPVLKDATNPAFRSKYSTLSSLKRGTGPALYKHRLLVLQQTRIVDGENTLQVKIIHVDSGEFFGANWKITPQQQTPQGEGSALTYSRRYVTTALLDVAAEDDDGAAASTPARSRAAAPAPAPEPSPEPSGRDWAGDAKKIAKSRKPAAERRVQLLALMEECRGFGELTTELFKVFVEHGNALKGEADAA